MATVKPADILIPAKADMEKWSVIACDQYTSEPEYWKSVEEIAGDSPSCCRLILPEAYLNREEATGAPERINRNMEAMIAEGELKTISNSFVYVKRTMLNGKIRHGIVGAIDLESYDWHPETKAAIKATERTVEERLYKRLEIRNSCCLELPHVLVFYSDKKDELRNKLDTISEKDNALYDFKLMKNGGTIKGYKVSGDNAAWVEHYFSRLEMLANEHNETPYAVGDGNHSLATAKLSWDKLKESLSHEELAKNPARYALVELINIYDEGIEIHPIHRVVKNINPEIFTDRFCTQMAKQDGAGDFTIEIGNGEKRRTLGIKANSAGEISGLTDEVIKICCAGENSEVDYIHDDKSAMEIGTKNGNCYILLPSIEKQEIFSTVSRGEIMPKKCFSIGHADEKRFYLEARKIR